MRRSGALTLVSFYQGDAFPLVNAGNTRRNTFNNGMSFFAQDDIRLRPNFTLNLGLRWEYFGPLGESHNLLSNLGSDGNLALVGTDGLDGAYDRDLNNVGPRVGFAWSLVPKTIVRGGYGVYFDYVPQDLLIANFTNSAGLATNPIGPQAVVSLSNSYDSSAFNGSMPARRFWRHRRHRFLRRRGHLLYPAQPGDAVRAKLEFEYPAGS